MPCADIERQVRALRRPARDRQAVNGLKRDQAQAEFLDDHAGPEHRVDVLAQFQPGLATVVVGQHSKGVPVAEGAAPQQPFGLVDLVEFGADVLAHREEHLEAEVLEAVDGGARLGQDLVEGGLSGARLDRKSVV